MAWNFLIGPSPVLMRELRASLRNAKAFGILALYVAILGAIVTANFPGDVSIDFKSDGGQRGRDLFFTLFWGQIALVLAIIPALATGALAQERERQTLQSLLATPLSPLQIVWGKAGGVLSLVGLMLLSTLPLTSLCFLLGGVDIGMLVAAYCTISGLAVFTTGFGLYCSARWPNATKALLACYGFLPIVLALVVVSLPMGALFSGLFCLYLLTLALIGVWEKGKKSPVVRKFDPTYSKAIYLFVPLVIATILFFMWYDHNLGLIIVSIGFIFAYFLRVTLWGMLQTANELMRHSDPETSTRRKIEDFKNEWHSALMGIGDGETTRARSAHDPDKHLAASAFSGYIPGTGAAPSQNQTQWQDLTPLPPAQASRRSVISPPSPLKETYGITPFLSDKLNPIFAREMRAGVLGKFDRLLRFSYCVTILSQVLLLAHLILEMTGPFPANISSHALVVPFQFWGTLHLALLLIFAGWFGARAIAAEREGQTLSQLLILPLPATQIIAGKMAAVLLFALYSWILAAPLTVLLGFLDLIPSGLAARFLVAELVLGFCAAAWGIFSSFHSDTPRKSLALSLGVISAFLFSSALVPYAFQLVETSKLGGNQTAQELVSTFFPIPLAFGGDLTSTYWPILLLLYAFLSVLLLVATARNFKKLANET